MEKEAILGWNKALETPL